MTLLVNTGSSGITSFKMLSIFDRDFSIEQVVFVAGS
jgi:hypothetical protein